MKKLYIETYGCQMNVADSEVVASVMQMAGYEPTESLDDADAVFLNTCSVRDNAEQKIYHRLDALDAVRRQRKLSPLIIGVLGCMAERVKEDLLNNHHADLVAGPDSYLSLPDLIAQVETGHKAINIELSTSETYRDVVPQRLHGAKIGDMALIGMGSIILDHAEVGEGAIVAAGSVVLGGTKIGPHELWAGSPAKFKKMVDPAQAKEINVKIAKNYLMYSTWYEE